MGSSESNPFVNFAIGLVVGVGASFLYIRFGIELPSSLGVGQRITSEAIVKTAELELLNLSNSPLVRHRALAVILANKPEKFLAVDQALNHRFLHEFLRQHRSGAPLNGPVVVNPPVNELKTISRSKIGTTVIRSGAIPGIQTVNMVNQSEAITKALLRQRYPDASNEIIGFLVSHPKLRSPSVQVGRQAALPLQIRAPNQ